MQELVFTPAALLGLLTQIDELKDLDIQIVETSNNIQLSIGGSTYIIGDYEATDIKVEPDVIEDIEDANSSAYQELESLGEIDLSESVESGVLKQIAKTLMVGGLVRLTSKLLK